ncbi:WD40/YVTN/BNR-like repeat-containing protein, partial [Novosphingobium rosa]
PNRLWVGGGTGPFYADFPPGTSVANWVSQARGIEELVTNDAIQAPGQSPIFAGWDFGMHVKDDLNAFSTTFGPNERGLMSVQQMDWSPSDPSFVVSNASDARHCCSEDGNAVMAGYSTDGGRTWTKFATLPTPPGEKGDDPWRMSYGAIAVSSSDVDNIIWEPSDNRKPFYTKDRGKTWSPVHLPGEVGDKTGSFPHMWQQRKTLTADKTTGGTFYLYHSGEAPNIALQGLWRSRDGGANWTRVFPGEIAPSSGETAKLRSVPGHAGHLFFTSAVNGNGDTGLRRSTDGGASWSVVAHVDHVDDVAFGKAAKGAAYPTIFISGRVDGRYGIWRSVDNAGSWQLVADFPA